MADSDFRTATPDHADPARDATRAGEFSGQGVAALFPNRDSADRAFRLLTEHGYESHEVDVIMSARTHRESLQDRYRDPGRRAHGQDNTRDREPRRAMQGAGVGASVGGAVGAVAAAMVAASASFALPGLGVVFAGPLMALAAGGTAGGLTGGVIGALIGWGVPTHAAEDLEAGLRRGGIVLRVRPHNADDANVIGIRWRELDARLIAS